MRFKAYKQKINFQIFKSGSAMILTMFILAGILIVAMSGAYIVLVGITSSGFQAQSTKSYFAAEAGTEYVLWDLRKNGNYNGSEARTEPLISGDLQTPDVSFEVYFTKFPPRTYMSIGSFMSTKRSVEISF
jgi:hypothetical protein